jgi:hypothetical protein
MLLIEKKLKSKNIRKNMHVVTSWSDRKYKLPRAFSGRDGTRRATGYGYGWSHPIPIPVSFNLTRHLYPYPSTDTKFSHICYPP